MSIKVANISTKFKNLAAATAISGAMFSVSAPFLMAQDIEPDQSIISASSNDNGAGNHLFEQSFLESAGSPIDFNNPWAFLLLLGLPFLWRAARSTPQNPVEVDFGPMFILEQLETQEVESDHMPVYEKMIWMAAATSFIIAAADTTNTDRISLEQEGPVLVVIDADWASSNIWDSQREALHRILRHAHNSNRLVSFLNTVVDEDGNRIEITDPMSASLALSYVENVNTVPWPADRLSALNALSNIDADMSYGATFWVSNGIADDYSLALEQALRSIAPLSVYDTETKPYLLMPAQYENGSYHITVQRAEIGYGSSLTIQAFNADNQIIMSQQVAFEPDDRSISTRFSFLGEASNASDVQHFSIQYQNTAGATILVSPNYMPRTVGIAAIDGRNDTASLLNEARFLYAAISPYTEIRFGGLEELLDRGDVSIIKIPDSVPIPDHLRARLESWVQGGGTVVRFAGPNMSTQEHANDPLLPLDIQRGSVFMDSSTISAATSEDLRLSSVSLASPFNNIAVEPNVVVRQYVAPMTSQSKSYDTWASLSNGMPLVTAGTYGQGRVVLFHTTANASWSDFAFTDNFVDMLINTIRSSNSIEVNADFEVPDLESVVVLNSAGQVRSPAPTIQPINQSVIDSGALGPQNPPGLYGNDIMQVPFNISSVVHTINPLSTVSNEVDYRTYQNSNQNNNFSGWLIAASIAMAMLGSIALGARNGAFGRARRNKSSSAAANNTNYDLTL